MAWTQLLRTKFNSANFYYTVLKQAKSMPNLLTINKYINMDCMKKFHWKTKTNKQNNIKQICNKKFTTSKRQKIYSRSVVVVFSNSQLTGKYSFSISPIGQKCEYYANVPYVNISAQHIKFTLIAYLINSPNLLLEGGSICLDICLHLLLIVILLTVTQKILTVDILRKKNNTWK